MAKPPLTLVENTGENRPRAIAGNTTVFARARIDAVYPQQRSGAEQLHLPFDQPSPPQLLISIVAMESVHGRVLNQAIAVRRPKTVLDLRHAAIFNQYGSSREVVFRHLSELGSYYALVSMPWHTLTQRDFMTDSDGLVPRVRHELLERDPGSVMLFVPKPEHANMLAAYLNRLLSTRSKVSWQLEQVQ